MRDCLKKLGYETIAPRDTEQIETWFGWYQGKVSAFHSYSQYNGKKKVRRNRAALCMAKRVCEDWANLLLNEKVEISTSDESNTARAKEILNDNHFRVRANRLVELTFALGTGAFVEFIENGRVSVDYIRADMIFPLTQVGAAVTECAFGSVKRVGKKECLYVQLHVLENGRYVILNRMFDKKTHAPLPLPQGVLARFETGSRVPLFQLITPNIVNNASPDSPMGISVFANAIDVLKGIDLVYDSYQNEFRLGKKRIVVPVGMAQLNHEESGFTPVFDDNDTEFYAFTDKNMTDLREINMKIRAQEHSEGLAKSITLLSELCGLGADRYKLDTGSANALSNSRVKTATEVVSEESALYQNLKKHALILDAAICALVRAVLFLDGKDIENLTVSVDFDDSIIHDTDTEFSRNVTLVEKGLMQPYEFRMWWFSETEEQAKKKLGAPTENGGEGAEHELA